MRGVMHLRFGTEECQCCMHDVTPGSQVQGGLQGLLSAHVTVTTSQGLVDLRGKSHMMDAQVQ